MKILSFISALIVSLTAFPLCADAVDIAEISAKGAVLLDPVSGEILFAKNAEQKLPMASTTKIMSALIALESGNLDEEFVVDSDAIKIEGSSMGLQEGDRVTMRTLVHGMLLPSGNDAANAAAVRISGSVGNFVQLMNDRAAEMGLDSTHFVTPSGLDDDTDEHYSTPLDMAKLTVEAMKNPDFRDICRKYNAKVKFGNPPYERWLRNSNKLLNSCEGVIGVKTGFTDKAKRCLVSACERNGATLICVTLNAPDDWLDHSRLYDYGFTMFEKQRLNLKSNEFSINVVGGEQDDVLCTTDIPQVAMLRDMADDVDAQVYIDHFLYAPVAENTVVGKVRYSYNGQVISEQPIVTAEPVEYEAAEREQSFWEKIKDIFD
ncbi:MAG: D-alanyl-D-alanine carboxypeptidase family protein [Ruminococcus sp.]|nr:D-alanyl-D-alanine carboxypeptidase family protein [Ruminococcus sp.]